MAGAVSVATTIADPAGRSMRRCPVRWWSQFGASAAQVALGSTIPSDRPRHNRRKVGRARCRAG